MLRACIIAGDRDLVWASPIAGFRVPNGDHPWLKRNPGEAFVNTNIELPPTTLTGGFVYGFTGFDTDL
jgi:hypothetical protein